MFLNKKKKKELMLAQSSVMVSLYDAIRQIASQDSDFSSVCGDYSETEKCFSRVDGEDNVAPLPIAAVIDWVKKSVHGFRCSEGMETYLTTRVWEEDEAHEPVLAYDVTKDTIVGLLDPFSDRESALAALNPDLFLAIEMKKKGYAPAGGAPTPPPGDKHRSHIGSRWTANPPWLVKKADLDSMCPNDLLDFKDCFEWVTIGTKSQSNMNGGALILKTKKETSGPNASWNVFLNALSDANKSFMEDDSNMRVKISLKARARFDRISITAGEGSVPLISPAHYTPLIYDSEEDVLYEEALQKEVYGHFSPNAATLQLLQGEIPVPKELSRLNILSARVIRHAAELGGYPNLSAAFHVSERNHQAHSTVIGKFKYTVRAAGLGERGIVWSSFDPESLPPATPEQAGEALLKGVTLYDGKVLFNGACVFRKDVDMGGAFWEVSYEPSIYRGRYGFASGPSHPDQMQFSQAKVHRSGLFIGDRKVSLKVSPEWDLMADKLMKKAELDKTIEKVGEAQVKYTSAGSSLKPKTLAKLTALQGEVERIRGEYNVLCGARSTLPDKPKNEPQRQGPPLPTPNYGGYGSNAPSGASAAPNLY